MVIDNVTIQDLSAAGRHQECLQACQQILQSEPENSLPWKYAGKSLLSLRQFEKAQQCLLKAHQLDGSDPEIVKDIGNLFLNIGNKDTAVGWYKKALEINNNYAPAINNLANIKRQSGNTQEAVELYKRVIQADPKLIQGYVGAAASFLELGDLDQAESFAAQALAINERTPGVNEICGIVLQNKNKSNEAIKCYQKELEVNPQASNSLLNLGLLHLQKGQTATGVESLSKASAIAPSEQCSLLLAQAYQNLGQLQAAIIEYKKLNINQSKNKMIPFNLGLCLLNTGNNIDAIEAFKTAIQLDDSFIPAWGNLGNSLKREGRLKEAIQATQKVLDLDPDNPTAHMNLGGIYKDLGQLDQALASTLQSLELKPDNPTAHMNLGSIHKELGQLDQALASTLQSLELKPDNPTAHMNLGGIYKELGQFDQALASTLQSLELKTDNPDALINLGGIYKDLGQLDQALASTLQSLELKPDNPDALINLGGIYKELGQFDQALASTLQSLELKPNNPDALINLGGIYKELGQLDQALASTLQSLELKPDNPTAHMNLGGIYKNLGQLDQALASTLKSLELKPNNSSAINYLNAFIQEINLNPSNAKDVTRAYEVLLNQTDISHRKLQHIFLQAFLPTIQKATTSDPIFSESNGASKALAADWRFRKSLTLLIPPSSEVEKFFTRLRKEILELTIQEGTIPQQLKPLTESLAAQCFLNEYVYTSSQEEDGYVLKLIEAAANRQEATNQYLAIISCYKAIHKTKICSEFINNYPTPDASSQELITAQFKEPRQEQEIKTSFKENWNVNNIISQKVQEMYEESPYPRFKYANYILSEFANTIDKFIWIEATRKDLSFSEELKSPTAIPKVLIAGCGSGVQVINSSCYRNAEITAIDLSISSLAYAIRKTTEYEMNNVTFKQMDLLNAAELGDMFDIIACSGVLHHMEKPSEGLSALIQQLKPGGFIKLGLYSEIARRVIVEARKIIQTLGITSTPESIRDFRKQVLDGKIQELQDLPKLAGDFYSLSECRDLCFHVQEHRYTTEKLKKLLDSHDLTFCGFMLPEQIKKLYQEQYPEDGDMTSLSNWGKFEEEHPSTFSGMYQFWAHKPI